MSELKMYVGGAYDFIDCISPLIFARSSKEAKKVAYREIMEENDCDYTQVRILAMKKPYPQHLLESADAEKIKKGIAHATFNMPACCQCEQWGTAIIPDKNGYCDACNPPLVQ